MELKNISATRLRIWLTCQLRYKFNYHSELEKPVYEHNKLGLVVHEVIKEIDMRLSKADRFPTEDDYMWAKEEFLKQSVQRQLSDATYLELGLGMVLSKLDSFDPSEKILALEKQFPTSLELHGVPVLGAFDKVVEVDEGTVAIIDYKTSRIAMTPYEAKDDIQMSFYDLIGSMIYPEYDKILLIWDYLRPNLMRVKISKTPEEREFFSLYVKEIVEQIKKTDIDNLAPTINKYCGWCEFRYDCPAYASYVSSMSKKGFKPAQLLTDEEIIKEWEEISVMKKILEGREREINISIYDRIQQTGKNLACNDMVLFPVQNTQVGFDVKGLSALVPVEDLVELVRVNKKAIDYYVAKHPELANSIMKLSKTSYSTPFFRSRKLKKDKNEGGQGK